MSSNFKYNVLYMVNFVYSILVDSFLMNLLASHNFPYIVSLQYHLQVILDFESGMGEEGGSK